MNKQRTLLSLAIALLMCFVLVACHGLIPPRIGDSAVAAANEEPAEETTVEEYTGIGMPTEGGEGEEGGGDESSSGGGEEEPVVAPVMTGNVVYHFHHEEMKSSSLGAMEQFTADADLFDEMNADGVNGAIHLTSGDSEAYITCVWTANEDGSLSLQTDEFNIYEAKDVDGVLTICGIRYSMGMMNSGAVDIPQADFDESYVPVGQGEVPGEAASEGGEAPADGAAPAEGEAASEGGAPAEGDVPAEGGDAPAQP